MDTPICDFVKKYTENEPLRMHMPGHKGMPFLGIEHLDITEIKGADALYEADGIIAQSEKNASSLFGCRTLYSTEGSSQCIRAMLYLILLYAKKHGKKPIIYAGRNAHKTFLSAASLLDIEVKWIYSGTGVGYLTCEILPDQLDRELECLSEKPTALYLTSPDYLGKTADVRKIAEVCHRHGVLLAVDNAHGAYLKFLPESEFPIDLGADICCSSAHKTLNVLTGGAYLHLSDGLDATIGDQGKNALMLFGSTSPSYLILQSLDMANVYLGSYSAKLRSIIPKIEAMKDRLTKHGFILYGNEALKLTIKAKSYGYLGSELADILRSDNIEPEFADPDHLTLMLSSETDDSILNRVEKALTSIERRSPVGILPPEFSPAVKRMTVREATFSDYEVLPTEKCIGRILALPSVGCPPAVPILVCGEEIDEHTVRCFEYYGIASLYVVKEK